VCRLLKARDGCSSRAHYFCGLPSPALAPRMTRLMQHAAQYGHLTPCLSFGASVSLNPRPAPWSCTSGFAALHQAQRSLRKTWATEYGAGCGVWDMLPSAR
jgi:hypothetical protein